MLLRNKRNWFKSSGKRQDKIETALFAIKKTELILEKMTTSQPHLKTIKLFLVMSIVVTFLLIVFGFITRTGQTNQTCPDWPTCYGQYTFPLVQAAWIQFIHRLLAVFSAGFMVVTTFLARHWVKTYSWITRPLYYGCLLLAGQIILGGYGVITQSSTSLAPVHLGLAMLVLGCLLTPTLIVFHSTSFTKVSIHLRWVSPFARFSILTLIAIFVLMISGAYLAANGSGDSCVGWPLCNGSLPVTFPGWLQLGHRVFSGMIAAMILYLFFEAWKSQSSQPVILTSSSSVLILLIGQGLIGALKVSRGFPTDLVVLHAVSSAALWAVQVVVVMAAGLVARTAEEERGEAQIPRNIQQRSKDFFILSKPLIMLLLLFTTFTGMIVGGRSTPSLSLIFWTLLGGALAAGGSSAVNQYIDRDLDKSMQRTEKRPLPDGRLTPAEGLAFGIISCLAGFYVLAGFVNLLVALLSLAGMVYYVLVYSIWLKRLTVQNIVIGGGAGAIPPLVGWAAATGQLDWNALFLFAIIFLWTPPHFWALALVRRKEYARVGIPMMPVVYGEEYTRKQIFIYTLVLVGFSLLTPLINLGGLVYWIGALLIGGILIYYAWQLLSRGGNKNSWQLYRYSSVYLTMLFFVLIVDVIIKT
jgi:heme o synthase